MKTRNLSQVVVLTFLLAALVVTNIHAAFDAFLKIEGVEGDAVAPGHEDQIEILSFSWGVSNPSALAQHGGTGSGGPVLLPVTMAKRIDKATPKLMRAAVSEELFNNDPDQDGFPIRMVLVYSPGGDDEPVEVFEIGLNDSQIAEIRGRVIVSEMERGDVPHEELSFSYGRMHMKACSVGRPGWDTDCDDTDVMVYPDR